MYLIFLKITFFTYFVIFVLKSICLHIFNNLIYPHLNKYISNDSEKWVTHNKDDEWILGSRVYDEKVESTDIISTDLDKDDNKELEIVSFKSIINAVMEENTSSFSIMSRSVLLLIYTKMMIVNGHIPELLLGLSLGLIMQLLALSRGIGEYMQQWYFGQRTGMDLYSVIVNKDKISSRIVVVSPLITILLVNLMRANVYSRIIGEWVVDLNMIYLYLAQICGFYIIQNSIRMMDYTKYSASVLFLVLMYSVLILLF